jgi:hypothetical protein
MTIAEFRKRVKHDFPHVTITVRTVNFSDLARASRACLTVTGDAPGECGTINQWAREAGIVPDGNIRCFPPPSPEDARCPDCRGGWQCPHHQALGVELWNARQAMLRDVADHQRQIARDRIAARYELESDEYLTADQKAERMGEQ